MRILIVLLALSLWGCQKTNYTVSKTNLSNSLIDSTYQDSNSIDAFITPYRKQINADMNKVLAFAPKAYFKNEAPLNTSLGNLMADAVMQLSQPVFKQRTEHEIDMVILNYGGIRGGISPGDVTTRTAFNIMPFENHVVVAKLDATQFKALTNYLVEAKRAHPIAGLKLNLHPNGSLNQVEVNGTSPTKDYYYVATSDYLVKGGDQMDFFTKADTVYQLDYKLRNLLLDYFTASDTLKAQVDQRFTQNNN